MPQQSRNPRAAIDALQAQLDPMSFPARMRALAAWTRERVGEAGGAAAGIRPLLNELDTRGPYGRGLAVVAASVAGDAGFLEARLADPDDLVRGHALKASTHLPIGDDALERALDDAPAAVRRQIAAAIVAGGRTALAERLLEPVREVWGDEEAVRLLPGCGPQAVARALPGLFTAVTRWRTVARRHPGEVLDEVARQLADLPEHARPAWWERNAGVLAAAADIRPLRVLELLERHCPARLPGPLYDCLGHLLKAAPGRTIRLITAPERLGTHTGRVISRSALARLARVGPPELAALGTAWSHAPQALATLLRALPPSRREAFYDTATAGQDLGRTMLADCLLHVLPRGRAQAEARRMAVQATERGSSWDVVLDAVAYLPPDEARPRLLTATRRPAADDRAVAYPLLVRNAAHSGRADAVATVLDDLQRLRNEQEPVRSPALAALAEVPPALFTGADAALLDRITADAVEARDSSGRTRQALSTLALRLLREHAVSGEQPLVDWSLTALTRLTGRTGGYGLGRLDTGLRRGQEFQVLAALRPWLTAGADRNDHGLTLALTHALGRRARHMPELQELLRRAVYTGGNATVEQAVGLWLDPPATRDERVALVLEREPSAAVLPSVLRILTRRRTDLLDAVLAAEPPYGRFLVAGSRWLPPVDGAAHWLPRQQAAAARLLARAAGDASLPKAVRAGHIHSAAAVPVLGREVVGRYLRSPDTVLAEAALTALAWTGDPQETLPLLLAHAGDDRARVAVYAATRVSLHVPPSRLAEVLRAALLPAADGTPPPAAKVTSRKELIRLAATRLPAPVAAAVLAGAFSLPDQHPDVRAACVPVATGLLRSPAAWEVLARAAEGPPVAQEALLRVQPYDLGAGNRPRYAELVGRVAVSGNAETADAATDQLARWWPWYPAAAPLLLERTADLDNRSSWRASAGGLVVLTASADGAGPLLEALSRLVAADAGETDPGPDRDRPARQRVVHLVTRLSATLRARDAGVRRTAALRAAELLCANADFAPQGIHLTAQALDLDAAPARLLTALEELAALHTDRPALAVRTAETLRQRLASATSPGTPEALLTAVEGLTANGGHATGLFATAITRSLGTRTNWPPTWRTPLHTLRHHPHPDVREAALSQWTAAE